MAIDSTDGVTVQYRKVAENYLCLVRKEMKEAR
jgi:hypothetical protein